MMKEFLAENTYLRISVQHQGIHGGGYMITVHNTTWDCFNPIFEHFITDFEMSMLRVDMETIIMTPIIKWWKDLKEGKVLDDEKS